MTINMTIAIPTIPRRAPLAEHQAHCEHIAAFKVAARIPEDGVVNTTTIAIALSTILEDGPVLVYGDAPDTCEQVMALQRSADKDHALATERAVRIVRTAILHGFLVITE